MQINYCIEMTANQIKNKTMLPNEGKGSSKTEAMNYRPMALTSHLIKILEKVIRKYIVCYMELKRFIQSLSAWFPHWAFMFEPTAFSL